MSLPPEDYLRRRVKAELRKRMRALRNTAPASACSERSHRIVERLDGRDFFANVRSAALFWPIEDKHEVDLRPLDARLRARGVSVAYPSIDPESGAMTFRVPTGTAALEERGRGFSEPPFDAEEASSLDVIVVPALALDPRGHRIGYGAGYYDRALPRFSPPARTIGVAFDYQIVAEVPVTETDVAVGWVVTDVRTFEAA
jgi:5-formyltetrahydrofolate cyclo-ligase